MSYYILSVRKKDFEHKIFMAELFPETSSHTRELGSII